MKDLGEGHLTDDKSFLRQTLKINLRITSENKKSQVRSWKKTYGLGPTQKETPLNNLKERLRRLN